MSTNTLRLGDGGVDPHWAQFIDFEADSSPPITQRKSFRMEERSSSDSEPMLQLRKMARTYSQGPLDSDHSPKENTDMNAQRVGERRGVRKKSSSTLRSYRKSSNANNLLPRTEALLMAIADSSITTRPSARTISPKKNKSVTFEDDAVPQEGVEKGRRSKSLGTLIGKLRRR